MAVRRGDWVALTALGVAVAALGVACQSGERKAHPVAGRVVYKASGEPATRLAGGYVCLQSVADPDVKPVGQIEDDGTFFLGTVVAGANLGGVPPGEYRVRVVPPTNADTGRAAPGVLDPRFASFDKSGLRITVVAGQKDLTIEVERPRR